MSLCGDLQPGHTFRGCKECKRIDKAMERGKTLEEAKAETTQPTCRTCKVRFMLQEPAPREYYNPIDLEPKQIKWLENAARVFELYRWRWTGGDPECDHRPTLGGRCATTTCGAIGTKVEQELTAADFIAWIKPDVIGMAPRSIDPALLRSKKDREVA
jgi:hypothetical protein